MSRSRAVALALCVAAVSACHPAAHAENGDSVAPRGRVVEAEDIARSGARNAWEALSLLGGYVRLEQDKDRQPARLTSRGRSSINLSSEPQIVLDGVRLVEYGILQNIGAAAIERIQLLTGPQASIRYGTNAGNGVILIVTRTTVAEAAPDTGTVRLP